MNSININVNNFSNVHFKILENEKLMQIDYYCYKKPLFYLFVVVVNHLYFYIYKLLYNSFLINFYKICFHLRMNKNNKTSKRSFVH